jgi:single-stranded-DNA-specific exonuclease
MARSAAPALNQREVIDQANVSSGSFKVFRKIRLKPQHEDKAALIRTQNSLSSVAARALAARGFEVGATLDTFLSPMLKTGLPHPDKLKNLSAACDLIAEIVAQKKSIAICCDFDVDGLSGGAQMFQFL